MALNVENEGKRVSVEHKSGEPDELRRFPGKVENEAYSYTIASKIPVSQGIRLYWLSSPTWRCCNLTILGFLVLLPDAAYRLKWMFSGTYATFFHDILHP